MKFTVSREALIGPLQLISNVAERRSTMPVLSNLLLRVADQQLILVATDLEVEMLGRVNLVDHWEEGQITVPAKKFFDLVRSLPDDAMLDIFLDADRVRLHSGRSKFNLVTLPATEFPNSEDIDSQQRLTLKLAQGELRSVLHATAFSMAVQDVRYYLNGTLFEVAPDRVRTVATDGHRLSVADVACQADVTEPVQSILPRKAVLELIKLLENRTDEITVRLSDKHIRVDNGRIMFTSKLVEGKFPDYRRVVPSSNDLEMVCDRGLLKATLSRVSILTNEKFRGVRINLEPELLRASASNPDQEEAEELLTVDYSGPSLDIGFNVGYMLDVLNIIEGEQVLLQMKDSSSSVLVRDFDAPERARYVIMPMRF